MKNHDTKPLITLGGYGKMRVWLTNNEETRGGF
ncbi:hypothetical protein BCE_3760 [Bacillus cereus ATCC 10987]|uniref:Uncharacterized protein n=1 Tax=Bacillus cereus (strain ATCC 10987 / NRS 248) TaxID=222523 RepID=Q733A0_BACC1|nr:hypothetical protein BCE_3760 [Bacillus cereus ATCC 10987]